jgi:hypothetical protein
MVYLRILGPSIEATVALHDKQHSGVVHFVGLWETFGELRHASWHEPPKHNPAPDPAPEHLGLDRPLMARVLLLPQDKHWRVRLAIISHIPLLASQVGVGEGPSAFFAQGDARECSCTVPNRGHAIVYIFLPVRARSADPACS